MLGLEPESSPKKERVLSLWTISPAPVMCPCFKVFYVRTGLTSTCSPANWQENQNLRDSGACACHLSFQCVIDSGVLLLGPCTSLSLFSWFSVQLVSGCIPLCETPFAGICIAISVVPISCVCVSFCTRLLIWTPAPTAVFLFQLGLGGSYLFFLIFLLLITLWVLCKTHVLDGFNSPNLIIFAF